ncbi:DNA-binding response regulator, OmpR family, contains REC and winged-helix (wHTH) domain [Acetitomaculum ruminis DSM 5522]|uniref:Stage 0 sporulation protein A homolog n=1 Tax=Acetitomaculum ruminis DSM 5522 TaxID=1120918 RepID=A0A1I0YI03_9FIRM|nr:response regulator transcription factor [Acetitomaculum ruminis]SFB12841.1 DNA-binding response regulator, OmpR family, contains REC and winged-helix (wHTH) domain [Acetitomaculum ruminis DSM 5522]
MQYHILIVEDEEKLARFIELELMHESYIVTKTFDGRSAYSLIMENDYDLILLDIMLPGLNGLEVLRRVQHDKPEGSLPPVILLTARDAVMDKVTGLDAGAADYITKPFAIEELLARIRVVLKLYGKLHNTNKIEETAKDDGELLWDKLVLNEKKHEVKFDGQEITLTNREFMMLKTLLENMDIVLSRDTLLEKVCGYDYIGETNVVDVYIRFLRSKIDETFGVKMIHTVRGVGYVIKSGS